MTIADKLLKGSSLRIVLHPDVRVQVDFPDMFETFELRHIILHNNEFFAKTSNIHALSYQFTSYDMRAAYSYAYSNYVDMVVNCSQIEGLMRFYDAKSYLERCFVTVPDFRTVWEWGRDGNISEVEKAVRCGQRLKIALLDKDNFWNIHPVHMPSFYVGQNYFELFTDQDSVPLYFRYPSALRDMYTQLTDVVEKKLSDNPNLNISDIYRSSAPIVENPEFYSCYYTVYPDGNYLRGAVVQMDNTTQQYKALKIFAEVLPE